ncbi:hypothetical protein PG999_001844 [Apiospora kogelbergensis]|uniref:Beta/Gamma crystallin n=1 Tax=Apiospora kogelbergensis TaxID=1337665 RepID=A0AAW0R6I5_9PEZI
MRFSTSAMTIHLLALGSQAMPTNEPTSLRVPSGQPNGAYVVYNWGKPNGIHERIPEIPEGVRQDPVIRGADVSSTVDASSALFKRFDPTESIACGCVDLNHDDWNNATRDLQAKVGRRMILNLGDCVHSIKGSVVAFFCLTGSAYSPAEIRALSVSSAWNKITRDCGRYKAGTSGYRGQYAYGYMTSDHANFRGDAWSSWRISC